MHSGAHRDLKRALGLLKLELHAVVNHPMWVLRSNSCLCKCFLLALTTSHLSSLCISSPASSFPLFFGPSPPRNMSPSLFSRFSSPTSEASSHTTLWVECNTGSLHRTGHCLPLLTHVLCPGLPLHCVCSSPLGTSSCVGDAVRTLPTHMGFTLGSIHIQRHRESKAIKCCGEKESKGQGHQSAS